MNLVNPHHRRHSANPYQSTTERKPLRVRVHTKQNNSLVVHNLNITPPTPPCLQILILRYLTIGCKVHILCWQSVKNKYA